MWHIYIHFLAWKSQNTRRIKLFALFSASGATYYAYHLDKAPITGIFTIFYQILFPGRIRFINVDINQEEAISRQSFEEIYKQNSHLIISPSNIVSIRIKSIVKNLEANIHKFVPELNSNFQVFVVDNEEPNAFVLPGGQIFVNTGILKIASTDDELAAVLAHEVKKKILKNINFQIAHKIARHGAEKMSVYQFFSLILSVGQIILTGGTHSLF